MGSLRALYYKYKQIMGSKISSYPRYVVFQIQMNVFQLDDKMI